MRRCYFKTANSQQLKLFIFHCVTFLESLFRKDCGALILKQPTAVIIHFPLRDNFHPFKIIRSQKLVPADYPRRLQMCRYLVTLTPADLTHFLFSDEANFDLDGNVNTQNVRRYAPRKGSVPAGQLQGRPAHFRQKKGTFSAKVMVFLGEYPFRR